ncbi:cyanobactin maturation protease PatG family protein [Nostoc commune]|uniref:cyanobactin maturation protease PatG family protein n=1 Tax=Nostoc commune TaxID=1178 RepID=UPI002B216448|nr:DNA methyltransferase [Nostoc commune]
MLWKSPKLVQLFQELRRLLQNQGTVWLIIGETRKSIAADISIIENLISALKANGWLLRKDIVWVKPDKPGERDDHILLFSKTEHFYYNAEVLPSDVLHINREAALPGYGFDPLPTQLIESCLLAGSQVGDTILDPFCGSGTVGFVTLKHERKFIGIELSSYYLEIAWKRLEELRELTPSVIVADEGAEIVTAVESIIPDTKTVSPSVMGSSIETAKSLTGEISISATQMLPAESKNSDSVKASVYDSKSGSLVYAMGTIGYDFGSEARKDSLVQDGRLAQEDSWNPLDPRQLLANFEAQPWESGSIIWTLNQEATPVYAIQPAGPYAPKGYEMLRQFLSEQLDEGVERVSIPGISIGSIKLQSGITVPRIVPTIRGMYSWSTTALIRSVLGEPPADNAARQDYEDRAEGIQNFLDRIYYELRNLGKTPQERAINYAATNAFQLAQVFQQAANENMQLDTIEVEKSPLCRPESECWDVKLAFFDPERQNQRARKVYRFTVDVSDEVPVTIGRLRSWSMF